MNQSTKKTGTALRIAGGMVVLVLVGLLVVLTGHYFSASSPASDKAIWELMRHIGEKDIASVQHILDKGINLNHKINNGGQSALHLAVSGKSQVIAAMLIAAGANVNAQDNQGNTPLHAAVPWGYLESCTLLLASGAKVNKINHKGETPLFMAASYGSLTEDILDLLLKQGAKVNISDKTGMTPLHHVCTKKGVSLLLDAGADIGSKTKEGWTALHYNSNWGRLGAVKGLVLNKAAIDEKDNRGRTPLMLASLNGYPHVVRYLIENGSHINTTDLKGNTALHYACLKTGEEITDLLTKKFSPAMNKNTPQEIDREFAARKEIAEILINAGIDVNIANAAGETALNLAVKTNPQNMIDLLAQHQKEDPSR